MESDEFDVGVVVPWKWPDDGKWIGGASTRVHEGNCRRFLSELYNHITLSFLVLSLNEQDVFLLAVAGTQKKL